MWGRRRKRKRGGQLERQLALGRLEDALGEVDRAQADSAQEDAQEEECREPRREQAERDETDKSLVSSRRAPRLVRLKKHPGTNGNLQPVLS
jgi:hypothetical protein